jgi:exopolysaccharide/PEP-CTERM locus tyrosine autokinase
MDQVLKKMEPDIVRTRPLKNPNRDEIVRAQNPLLIDINKLRKSGYLPERDNDRRFRDLYRQIKRPLLKKALRANAAESAEDPRLIMATSALPGDGKTFTSINLALSLARERDVSVLLIDADLLKPQVSKIFGVAESPGLTDVLTDEKLFPESVVLATSIRGLSIMPAGPQVAGAAELLASDRMRRILHSLCMINPRWVVLLDSPPLLVTSEGRALLTIAGQVVLVVRAGLTPRQAVIDAIALVGESQAGGIVLNEARVGIMQSYYGYGTYGSYGTYGTDGDDRSPKI